MLPEFAPNQTSNAKRAAAQQQQSRGLRHRIGNADIVAGHGEIRDRSRFLELNPLAKVGPIAGEERQVLGLNQVVTCIPNSKSGGRAPIWHVVEEAAHPRHRRREGKRHCVGHGVAIIAVIQPSHWAYSGIPIAVRAETLAPIEPKNGATLVSSIRGTPGVVPIGNRTGTKVVHEGHAKVTAWHANNHCRSRLHQERTEQDGDKQRESLHGMHLS